MRGFLVRLVALLAIVPLATAATAPASTISPVEPSVSLNGYTALVEQEFADTLAGLRVAASSENAQSGDWERIKRPLAVLARNSQAAAAVWFVRPDGSYFTVAEGRTDQSLRDRAYFPTLMAGREVRGSLVVSKSTGKKSAILAVPVIANGRVVGALGVSMAVEKVAALVDSRMAFPPGVVFYALDGRGETALHRDTARLFEFATRQDSPTLAKAVAEMLARPEGTVRYQYQGAERTAIYKRSAMTGWVFALRW